MSPETAQLLRSEHAPVQGEDLLERARSVADELVDTPGPLADEVDRATQAAGDLAGA